MIIKNVIETNEGPVTFEGVLEGDELEVVVSVGLATLLRHGALPLIDSDDKLVLDPPGEVQ